MNKVQKPITMVRAEFIASLTTLINDSGLPAFIIEPILKDMLNDVRIAAQQQVKMDEQNYREALNEAMKNEAQCGE